MVRCETQGVIQVLHSFRVLAGIVQERTQSDLGIRQVRLDADYFPRGSKRSIFIADAKEAFADAKMSGECIGLRLDRLAVVGQGVSGEAFVFQDPAQIDVAGRGTRLDPKRLLQMLLCFGKFVLL